MKRTFEEEEARLAYNMAVAERDQLWDELRAAKRLLAEPFFYRRSPEQIEKEINQEVEDENNKVVEAKRLAV